MSKKFSHMGQAFSQLGQAFMLPIAILPVAGLLLGLGGALTNKAAVTAYPWLNQEWLQTILKVMNFAGSAVFNNLALIFSIGLAVGLAKGDKGTAGLAGGVAYLVYTATISGLLQLFSPKNTIDTGVLGAIVIGSVVAYLHNHYRKVELPQFLGFFGGSRFIPIISSLAAIVIGAIFFIIWPPIQSVLTSAGYAIAKMGSFGSFLYGFLLRLTGAVGLHHTIYPMFWYTALGGTADVAGNTVVGAQNIFFAQLADPNHHGLFTYGTRFFAGRFATMMFGLPGAGLDVMLHLGIDTVELQGKPFTMKVKEGDKVTPDTQLIEMDLKQVKDAGKDTTVMTLITNSNERVEQVEDIITSGQLVEAHNDVYSVITK